MVPTRSSPVKEALEQLTGLAEPPIERPFLAHAVQTDGQRPRASVASRAVRVGAATDACHRAVKMADPHGPACVDIHQRRASRVGANRQFVRTYAGVKKRLETSRTIRRSHSRCVHRARAPLRRPAARGPNHGFWRDRRTLRRDIRRRSTSTLSPVPTRITKDTRYADERSQLFADVVDCKNGDRT